MRISHARVSGGLAVALALLVATPGALAQEDKKKLPDGAPIVWTDRGDISSLDLRWGSGSPERAPKPPFKFLQEDTGGTNAKIEVSDSAGVKWSVKFDEEVHAEVAATRIVWAAGYAVDETYYVPFGRVEGARGLKRAAKFVAEDGTISKARFERRDEGVVRRHKEWDWWNSPLSETRELSGLVLVAGLVGNWDTKTSNNDIYAMRDASGQVREWYVVTDWGGSFGKMGGVTSHSKWDLNGYRAQKLVDKVDKNLLRLSYKGKGGPAFDAVPLEHAVWFAGVISGLTDAQLRDAFLAAGASEEEAAGFAAALRARIDELVAVRVP